MIFFTPIKLNSVRLKDKNILPLGEKPLCWHLLDTLVKNFNDVYVYASTELVMEYCPLGVKFIKRPTSLDSDSTLGIEIYSSFIKEIISDYYCLAHVTSPFLSAKTFLKGIEAIKNGRDSAFTVRKEQTFVWYDGNPINYTTQFISRTQDMNPIYIETSGYYMFSRNLILNGRRIGDNPAMIEVDSKEGLDIDVLEDYELACLYKNS